MQPYPTAERTKNMWGTAALAPHLGLVCCPRPWPCTCARRTGSASGMGAGTWWLSREGGVAPASEGPRDPVETQRWCRTGLRADMSFIQVSSQPGQKQCPAVQMSQARLLFTQPPLGSHAQWALLGRPADLTRWNTYVAHAKRFTLPGAASGKEAFCLSMK